MSIRIVHDGITYFVEGDSFEEQANSLAVLQRTLGKHDENGSSAVVVAPPLAPSGAKPNKVRLEDKRRFSDKKSRAINMLTIIREAGEPGLSSASIVSQLSLKSVKAVGAESGNLNKLLDACGMRQETVYSTSKTPGEPKMFYPEPHIGEAISKIEQLSA